MKQSGVGHFFRHFFGKAEAESAGASEDRVEAPGNTPSAAETAAKQEQATVQPSAAVTAAAKKMIWLRKTLEFEEDIAEKVANIHTSRNMLLFMHQYMLFKFENLHSIGVLSEKSYTMLTRITHQTQTILTDSAKTVTTDPKELFQENESLKRQLKTLYDKHVKSDIISEKELILEEEKAKILARFEELKKRYVNSQKKIQILEETNAKLDQIHTRYKLLSAKVGSTEKNAADLENTLRLLHEAQSRAKLLQSRVEHQERLIQSMAWENPGQKELVDSITALDEKKRELNSQLQDQKDMLSGALASLQDGDEQKQGIKSLIDENRTLYEELKDNDETLQSASSFTEAPSLLTSMENLQEDTFHLNELAKAKEDLASILQAKERSIQDMAAMFNTLKRENTALKLALEAKSGKMKALDSDPLTRRMIQTIAALKKENYRFQLEIGNLHHIVSISSDRNELADKKIKELRNACRETQYLKQEMERKDKLIGEYKKRDEDYRVMKRELYQFQSELTKSQNDCAKAINENAKLEAKIISVRSEYEGMISEYNKLFEGM